MVDSGLGGGGGCVEVDPKPYGALWRVFRKHGQPEVGLQGFQSEHTGIFCCLQTQDSQTPHPTPEILNRILFQGLGFRV